MIKIVLTGEKNVGKSTIVRRVLESFKGTVGGFLTKREPISDHDVIPICLYDIHKQDNLHGCVVGLCSSVRVIEMYPERFNRIGVETLTFETLPDLVIMDELGMMEKDASLFLNRVKEIMAADLNVLCVVKRRENPFLDRIKEMADIVYEVNKENREQVFLEIKERLIQ